MPVFLREEKRGVEEGVRERERKGGKLRKGGRKVERER